MKKYKTLLFIMMLLFFCRVLSAVDTNGIDVFISFYNKKIYYLNQKDIFFKVAITNNSKETFRFNIARNKYFNLDFEVITPTNISLKHADQYIIEKNSNQPAFFREFSLDSGEEYSFIVELSDFVKLENSGIYIVQCLFYPELNAGNNPQVIKSNKVTVNIRPPVFLEDLKTTIETETGKVLEREVLPPDDVVRYMINARQRGQWEKFFLYINLEKLYINNSSRAVEYRLSTETERITLLENFKKELMEDKIEKEILVIPQYFKVEKTEYTDTQAKVTVTEKFQYADYTAVKRYTYQLEKSDKFWLITGYIVENLGTE